TFLLWRRMKLWELRSYDQVIKLEQERLVYQARLRSRFGRGWRRKAPVESLMPLRLARYGVPLAETAPAGLAAAGIEPALLSPAPASLGTTPQVSVPEARQPELTTYSTERQQDAAPQAPSTRTTGEEISEDGSARGAAENDQPGLDAYFDAYQAYVTSAGVSPTPRQFAYYLMDAYGVTAQDGGPLSETTLGPVLQQLQQWAGEQTSPAAVAGSADDQRAAAVPAGDEPEEHPLLDAVVTHTPAPADSASARPAAAPAPAAMGGPVAASGSSQPGRSGAAPSSPSGAGTYVREPVAAPTGAAVDGHRVSGGVPHQTAPDVPSAGVEETPAGGQGGWESSVTDTGEATARLPEQQTDEPELDPVQQQIVTVAGWLLEAEEAGERLYGAEIARRLGLSARTGTRRLDRAREYLEEQRQQQGRAHLRSVRN
ncbi:hypothetical protein ABT390_35420, partial [Streptomyces aurantiacus]